MLNTTESQQEPLRAWKSGLWQLQDMLPMVAGARSPRSWIEEQERLGRKAALFRAYALGDHRANLTPEMKRSLRIGDTTLSEMNDNYCGTVIETMLDRIMLRTVEADTEGASAWIVEVMRANRMDALQVDVHHAALRDGNAFLLVDTVEERGRKRVRFTLEPAFDGYAGMCVLYGAINDRAPMLAVKLWTATTKEYADTLRMNLYWPNRIERFEEVDGESIRQLSTEPWVDAAGEPLGVPVVHFRNKTTGYSPYGNSEIESVIPLQDALNRTMYSMIATAENTAFPIRALIGDRAPEALTPGMMLSFYAKGADNTVVAPTDEQLNWLKSIRLEQFAQGELVPYLEQASWLKSEIFAVSNTPSEDIRSNVSGESLKQREVKLLGKIKRFEAHAGNAWEDALLLAHRVQMAYGDEAPPAFEELNAKWQDAQLRNNAQVIENSLKLFQGGLIDQRTALKEISHIFGWTDREVTAILTATERERNALAAEEQQVQQDATLFDPQVPDEVQRRMSEANAESQPAG